MVAELGKVYCRIRHATEELCEPLRVEDYIVQSMTEASPTKWHLAHTSWFFETFLLRPHLPNYQVHHPQFEYLFNSYYNAVGPQFSRPRRGLLSRPTVAEIYAYRRFVDEHIDRLLTRVTDELDSPVPRLLAVGLHHEQQHQELMLTDLKHLFAQNPLHPVYRTEGEPRLGFENLAREAPLLSWHAHRGGLSWVGHDSDGFAFDNETPRHQVFIAPFELASRLVTCGEYLEFMADGGYARPELWLSEGWDAVRRHGWRAPLYWENRDGLWNQFTLMGLRAVRPAEPVCHVSYFEADAFARWAGTHLPTEQQWEVIAAPLPVQGNFVDNRHWHPLPLASPGKETPTAQVSTPANNAYAGPSTGAAADYPEQLFGDVWEWTASPYTSYPGYRAPEGALGEYNAKFMCNQLVLRGGSCATPRDHIRVTYRNFFHPHARWQFTGIRLAKELATRDERYEP